MADEHDFIALRRHLTEAVAHMGTVTAAVIKRKPQSSAEDVLSAIADVDDARCGPHLRRWSVALSALRLFTDRCCHSNPCRAFCDIDIHCFCITRPSSCCFCCKYPAWWCQR